MDITTQVKDYYGKQIKKTDDLKTNACCNLNSYPKKYYQNIYEEIKNSYYGCGLVVPDYIEGCQILDLGCGTGLDVYILSQMVGESGKVIGLDMTPEQLEVAIRLKSWHMDKFNFNQCNVEFIEGYIELLSDYQIPESSLDVVVSNCVINLCLDKKKVFQEVFQALKNGGEFYFSDVYCSRRVPSKLKENEVLWGECLSGALYWNDFENLVKECGFTDPRVVNFNQITIQNKELEKLLEGYEFYSVTYRLFKLEGLEPDCEDYGQGVIYLGSIPDNSYSWKLDDHHEFVKGKISLVCGNTWKMLSETRFKEHFQFIGNFNTHYGIFPDCGKGNPFSISKNENEKNKNACC
jgi:arsenite methyltransferase